MAILALVAMRSRRHFCDDGNKISTGSTVCRQAPDKARLEPLTMNQKVRKITCSTMFAVGCKPRDPEEVREHCKMFQNRRLGNGTKQKRVTAFSI